MSQEIPKILAEFENYCSEEREHRLNAGGQFDVELFDEAVELADQAGGPGDVARALSVERATTLRFVRGLADEADRQRAPGEHVGRQLVAAQAQRPVAACGPVGPHRRGVVG